ncbi:MAG: DUF4143 domain-containing protein [Clostridiaceae bacterium]|nr:DUF4143 domain-containing protein [Clostridiaceae bacterium]
MSPHYWTAADSRYEVDFLIQRENDIFPVEVKAGAFYGIKRERIANVLA